MLEFFQLKGCTSDIHDPIDSTCVSRPLLIRQYHSCPKQPKRWAIQQQCQELANLRAHLRKTEENKNEYIM